MMKFWCHRIKLLRGLLGAILLYGCVPGVAMAEDSKKDAVRYADVWCRNAPTPSTNFITPRRVAGVFLSPQNEPVIVYVYHYANHRARVLFYDFFKGEVIGEYLDTDVLSQNQNESFSQEKAIADRFHLTKIKSVEFDPITPTDRIRDSRGEALSVMEHALPDGSRLRLVHAINMIILQYGMQKVDAQGNTVFDTTLLLTTAGKQRVQNAYPTNEFWEGRSDRLTHNEIIFPIIYDLRDGTYLLTGLDWPGMARVRFGDNLESPCFAPTLNPLTGELEDQPMAVDGPWLRNLYREALEWEKKMRRETPGLLEATVSLVDGYISRALRERFTNTHQSGL